jgi:nitroreductase
LDHDEGHEFIDFRLDVFVPLREWCIICTTQSKSESGLSMHYGRPITDIIRERFSCRTYLDAPIGEEIRQKLEEACSLAKRGPFGTKVRYRLVAAAQGDLDALKGLGTYGFVRGATGFVLGAVGGGDRNLEDFGCRMEEIVLFATDLGLGSCWLGGTFTKSSFAARMGLRQHEWMPSVVSVGYIAEERRFLDRVIRQAVGAKTRQPWASLFFAERFGVPLSRNAAGAYYEPLEMVRLGPSAANRQPWRIVKGDGAWHFFVEHGKDYQAGLRRIAQPVNLQRVDMGIAMCHFELAAREAGLTGRWVVDEPDLEMPDGRTEYTASWVEDGAG